MLEDADQDAIKKVSATLPKPEVGAVAQSLSIQDEQILDRAWSTVADEGEEKPEAGN